MQEGGAGAVSQLIPVHAAACIPTDGASWGEK